MSFVRFAFAALLLLPLAMSDAHAEAKHRLALQISDNDPAKMNAVLNVAANVSKYYSDKGEEVDVQIVAPPPATRSAGTASQCHRLRCRFGRGGLGKWNEAIETSARGIEIG